jgi:hypothetical protein
VVRRDLPKHTSRARARVEDHHPMRGSTLPPDTAKPGGQVRPFADVLRDLDRGRVADQASVSITDLVRSVIETGKKGRVTLHVEIEPWKGNAATLQVSARVDSRLPQDAPAAGIFFPDADGNLHRNDPSQPTFDDVSLRQVARPDAELRDAR